MDGGTAYQVGVGPRAPIDPVLLRQVASRSFVLLSNPRGLLPLPTGTLERLALIGPNAIDRQTQGGGSIRVLSVAGPGLADALRDSLDTPKRASSTTRRACWSAIAATTVEGLSRFSVSATASVTPTGATSRSRRRPPRSRRTRTWSSS